MGSLTHRRPRKFSTIHLLESGRKKRDSLIVQEFRANLRAAEELVSKLGYSLRELQDLWRRPTGRAAVSTPLSGLTGSQSSTSGNHANSSTGSGELRAVVLQIDGKAQE